MKIKALTWALLGLMGGVTTLDAANVRVTMNSVSKTMTLVSKTTGSTVNVGTPSSQVYTFETEPGEYVLEGFATSGNNTVSNGTIDIRISDISEEQEFKVFTVTAYATNKNEDNSPWSIDTGDYTMEVTVNSREGVRQNITTGKSTTAGRSTFLALNGNSYFVAFNPGDARRAEGYTGTFKNGTVTFNATASVAIPQGERYSVSVPEAAEFDMGIKMSHFVDFSPVTPLAIEEKDGYRIYSYFLAQGQQYNYRTRIPGKMTRAGYFTFAADASRRPQLAFSEADYEGNPYQINHDVKSNQGYETGDIFVNVNPQGHLELRQGETFKAHAMRSWQLTDSSVGNYFFEPEFHYTVLGLDGKPDNTVLRIDSKPSSAWADITAVGQGTAIVLVTYDAINLEFYSGADRRDFMGGNAWGAIWPENTAVYVVTVDGTKSSVLPNMTVNEEYNDGAKKLAGKYIDAEHDVFYYLDTEEGARYTFKPEGVASVRIAYPTIGERMAIYTGFCSEGVTRNDDGSYTLLLKHGRQIVCLTDASGNSVYQVITAKRCHRDVVNATRPGSSIFQPGDDVKIQYSGLFHPANKLAGIYNMSAYVTYNGIPSGTSLILGSNQYTFGSASSAQAVTVRIPDDYDVEATPRIMMDKGVIQVKGFGDPIGSHRDIDPVAGRSANFTAIAHETYFGRIPDLTINLSPLRTFGIRLDNVPENADVTMTFKNSPVMADAETGLYAGTYGDYMVVGKKAGYRCYRNTFNIADDAEGLQTFKVEMEQSADCWDGETIAEPAVVDGIYQISSGRELAWFARQVNTVAQNLNAVLTADIDLGNYDWTPIGDSASKAYSGTFSGGNHRVKGLFIDNKNAQYLGLFGYVKGVSEEARASISGVEVDGHVSGKAYAGGIVGYVHNYVDIESCANRAAISVTGNNCGGIAGYFAYNTSSVRNSFNSGDIAGSSNCGGIAGGHGTKGLTAENLYNAGVVSSANPATGAACFGSSYAKGDVKNMYAVKAYGVDDGSVIVTEAQMSSGEVAFRLGAPFGQNIGTDAYPVLNGEEVRCDENFRRYYNVPEDSVGMGGNIIVSTPGKAVDPKDFWKYGISVEYGVFGQIQKNEKTEGAVVMTLDGKQIGNALTPSAVMLTVNPSAVADAVEDTENRMAQYIVRFPFISAEKYDVAPGVYEITVPSGFFSIDGAPVEEFTQTWIVDLDPIDIEPLVSLIEPGGENTPEDVWTGSLAVTMLIEADVAVNPDSNAKVVMALDGEQIGEALSADSPNLAVGNGDAEPLDDMDSAEPLSTPAKFVFLIDEDYKAQPGVYEMTIPAGFLTVNGSVNLEYTHKWIVEKPEVIISRPSVNPVEGSVEDSELRNIVMTLADGIQATEVTEESGVKLFKTAESGMEAVDGYKYNVTLGPNGEIILSADDAPLLPLGSYRLLVPAGTFSVEDTESPEFSYIYVVTTLGADSVFDDNGCFDIFTIGGLTLKRNGCIDDVKSLAPGIYIINGRRVRIRK